MEQLEKIDVAEYVEKIASLTSLEANDNHFKENLKLILDDLMRKTTIMTFERNMNIFPTENSSLRRI